MSRKYLAGMMIVGGIAASAGISRGDFIVDPTAALTSTHFGDRSGTEAINGDGLSSNLATNDPVPMTYPTHNQDADQMWLSLDGGSLKMSDANDIGTGNTYVAAGDVGEFIQLNLGQQYLLSGLHLWNYNEGGSTSRGIQTATLTFSDNGSDFSGPINETFTEADNTATDPGETYTLSTPVDAQYVRITVDSNYGDSYAGISEVRFTATVPEPASLSLMALACAGMLARRRRA